jgi:hypothetical protein
MIKAIALQTIRILAHKAFKDILFFFFEKNVFTSSSWTIAHLQAIIFNIIF